MSKEYQYVIKEERNKKMRYTFKENRNTANLMKMERL